MRRNKFPHKRVEAAAAAAAAAAATASKLSVNFFSLKAKFLRGSIRAKYKRTALVRVRVNPQLNFSSSHKYHRRRGRLACRNNKLTSSRAAVGAVVVVVVGLQID